jgi:putative aminopeptidase FrvX
MNRLEDYLLSVEKREAEIVAFLKELVKTPSLSGEEGTIAGIISDKLTELGYSVDVDGMGNIIAQRGGGNGKTILFARGPRGMEPRPLRC